MTKLDRWIDQQNTRETPKPVDLSGYAPSDHNHDTTYAPKTHEHAEYVKKTGNETIAGVKTFSSLPVLPTATPTTNNAIRKGYADNTYLGITDTAKDSEKLGGVASFNYALKTDLPAEPTWQSWTPTLTGWAASGRTLACRYSVSGKTVHFTVYVYGTSNGTSAIIGLPYGLNAVNIANLYWRGVSAGMDNGSSLTTPIMWQIAPNGSVINVYSSLAAGSWTSSGNKFVAFEGFYETGASGGIGINEKEQTQ